MGAALWAEAQLPVRLLFAPELARGALHASLWACLARGEGRLRGRGLLCAAAEALFLPLLIPFVLVRAAFRSRF